jgi:L-lactate dehydrogenase complex protein LldG
VNAREAVLAELASQRVEAVELPAIEGEWTRYPDPRERFRDAVAEAAGSVVSVGIGASLQAVVDELEVVRTATVRCSLTPMVTGNSETPLDAHAFAPVDVLIVPAQFGVAENGAVWIDQSAAPLRAALFLTQHLVVLLPIGEIVDNLHQAYERLGSAFGASGFGCFMSGPSKTADIEQALVVGAHGARSLTIVEY